MISASLIYQSSPQDVKAISYRKWYNSALSLLAPLNPQLSTFPKLPDAAEFLVALAEEFFEGELGKFVEVAGDGVL